MNSCLIIAGEKSGEEHALSFFSELKKLCPDVNFYGVGGDELKGEGMELLYHLKDFSSMGFSEVIHKIPFYYRALSRLEDEAVKRKTSTAILIDFQDFNMRLAERLKKRGIKVLYYVAPQAWAWKEHRSRDLAKNTHTLFTILPFEKEWFAQRGVSQIRSIPHPLMLTYKHELNQLPLRPFGPLQSGLRLLLLPGSRRFEVYNLLPDFMRAVWILRQAMKVEVHLVRVGHIDENFYRLYEDQIDFWYSSQELATAMKTCHMAMAASGTVTLSTALFELPTVVCYRASLLNEFIFNNLINYKGPISLTNIIHNKIVFPEFTQGDVDPHRLARVIKTWTKNEMLYNDLKSTLKKTKDLLGGESFSVPEYMARIIYE
jgi:lipid-A-disaccharide synthase